ncbi:MAG: 16S rRNA (guanine(966)-N(2))-methyltransferase RsmD [candidate division WOR-3 bacterium]
MKILAGSNKGRYLKVAKTGIRPTKAIVRSAIFNILRDCIYNADVIDIFAGTGALGIEALSQGARTCVFIEQNPKVLLENIKQLKIQKEIQVIRQDFRPALKKLLGKKFDIAFIDPPYKKGFLVETLRLIYFYGLMRREGIIVAEYPYFNRLVIPQEFIVLKEKKYGDTLLSFLRLKYNNKELE